MILLDEVAGNAAQEVGLATISKPKISVRELLHIRVELEWRANEDQKQEQRKQAADPVASQLNVSPRPSALKLFTTDADQDQCKLDRMCATAEQAFLEQQIFVLLDDRQAESLDDMIEVERTGTATFLLLTPLQGG